MKNKTNMFIIDIYSTFKCLFRDAELQNIEQKTLYMSIYIYIYQSNNQTKLLQYAYFMMSEIGCMFHLL